MASESEEFCSRLSTEVPGLHELWAQHLAEYEGKPLPYFFMLEVAGRAEDLSETAPATVQRLLGLFTEGLESGSVELHNLVIGGFIESLTASTPLRPRLGSALAAARELSISGGMSAPD